MRGHGRSRDVIEPPDRRSAFRRALDAGAAAGGRRRGRRRSWSDAELAGRSPADPMPTDPDWAGGTCCRRADGRRAAAPADAVPDRRGHRRRARLVRHAGSLWRDPGLARQAGRRGRHAARPPPPGPTCGSATPSTSGGSRRSQRRDAAALRAEMQLPGEAWLEVADRARRRRQPPRAAGDLLSAAGCWAGHWYALRSAPHALIFKRSSLIGRRARAGRGGHPAPATPSAVAPDSGHNRVVVSTQVAVGRCGG